MVPIVSAPSSGGQSEFLANVAREVEVWRWVASLDATARDPAARDVRPVVGSDQLLEQAGVLEMTQIFRVNFAPGALDSVSQDVARLLDCKRAAQTMGVHVARFDLLRRKSEARMQTGAARSGQIRLSFADGVCAPSLAAASLVLASTQGNMRIAAAGQRAGGFSTHWAVQFGRVHW